MNIEIIDHLHTLYIMDEFIEFMEAFMAFYKAGDTAERLALLLHFSCEWYMAETCDLPRMLAEIA